MKLIPLTQGKFAQVDDEDYEFLMQWKWYAHYENGRWYAIRTDRTGGIQRGIKMHRLILGVTDPKIEVDHKDFDGVNNLRENIRKATHSQNQKNKKSRGVCGYLGVHIHITKKKNGKEYRYYRASISINKKIIKIGLFKTEEEAAKAYDTKAKELHGEFANLNFKTQV